MANVKITELTALTDPASTDVLPIVDVVADVTKKISIADLLENAGSGTAAAPGIAFDGDSNTGIYRPGADQLAISTGGTGRLFIDSAGRLLVQSSSAPTQGVYAQYAPLTVQGYIGSTTGNGILNVARGATASSLISGSDIGTVVFSDSAGGEFGRISCFADAAPDSNDYPGRIGFYTTASGASSPTERMRISSSNTISLGNLTTPASANIHLDLYCNSSYDAFIRFRDESGAPGLIGFDHGSNAMQFYTNGASEAMRIDSVGRVGIGTSNPSYELSIYDPSGSATIHLANGTVGSTSSDGARLTASTNGILYLENLENAATVFTTNNIERARIDSAGCVGIGETSVNAGLDVKRDVNPVLAIDRGTANTANFNLQYNGTLTGQLGAASNLFQISAAGASTPMAFYANGQERMRIAQNGVIRIGQTTSDAPAAANIAGAAIGQTAYISVSRAGDLGIEVNRISNDGVLMRFLQDGTLEGSISVSGTDVTLNGATLSRWSQLAGGAERIEILRGSVLSNLDEMCEWGDEDNEQMNRMKVSDVEGDINVAGVFRCWDDDDDVYTNDFYCAMTGDFVIRIAQGTTVARGDLLMSAGDGTAKPQDDDIVRSKTIAKVTSTHVSETYADGSYCVPCVLMAC